MIIKAEDHLSHIGTPRKSGRYPWGSGGAASARNRDLLGVVKKLKEEGMSDKDIATGMGISTTDLVDLKRIALTRAKLEKIDQIDRLADKGWSNSAIGRRMGVPESTVRSLRAPGVKAKAEILQNTADMLKRQVEAKKYIDVGRGVELDLPISDGGNLGLPPDKLRAAVTMLRQEGYTVHHVKVLQVTTGHETTRKVLAKPDVPYSEVYRNRGEIKLISEHSDDRGRTWNAIEPPKSISSRRVAINYAEDGGAQNDGVIHLRPGVKDLSLGAARYAQVRIAVDSTHYLKGMAVHKDDLPEGVDVVFNTNKSNTGRKKDAMKEMEKDASGNINVENPFTSSIKRQKGYLNIVNEEGDWDKWSNNLSSQVLSKQKPSLAKQQLAMKHELKQKEFDEISRLTNPSVRKYLLERFADQTDSDAVDMQAHHLPRQATKVILPLNSMKPHEIYAPSFNNGDRVALIRFPHGGTFEIPELTVNNRNPEAKKILGTNAIDAVGIHHKVAERLSGADFDGDHVLVIPNAKKLIEVKPALDGLKGFDPQTYKRDPASGVPKISKAGKEYQMGSVSNLITDMTIRGAGTDDIARAIRHSMVVIDSEKHDLDYRKSARDHDIRQLKEKYQKNPVTGKSGASTIISRARSDVRIPNRELRKASLGGPIDPVTGKKVFVDTGESFVSPQTGKTVVRKQRVDRLSIIDDAHTLVSDPHGTPIERVYADHSNKLKAMANSARKESLGITLTPSSKSAKVVYSKEVASLNAQLNIAKKNAPLERQAQTLANVIVAQKKQADPNMDSDTAKKIKNKAIDETRARLNAGKTRIRPTQEEWNAIQAGAISNSKLHDILTNGDLETIKKLATPRDQNVMTSSKAARAVSMLSLGYTQAEVAGHLGVSPSTLKASISE